MFEDVLSSFLQSFAAQSLWEWLAAALGIAYVILAAKESPWAWPAAFVSTLIYSVLFWEGQLPMQSLLNVYYLMMAVYGWKQWNKKKVRSYSTAFVESKESAIRIQRKPICFNLAFIGFGALFSYGLGTWMDINNLSVSPYLDAIVTIYSIMVTYLMVHKVLENWLYWIVIDSLAIFLYWQNGYFATVLMFILYLAVAVYGYWNWYRIWHSRYSQPAS